MANKHYRIHHFDFIILLVTLTIGAFFIIFLNSIRSYQIAAVIAMSLTYFLWGLVHHYRHKDLHIEIALEYLLIAILGAAILISIITKA